MNRYIDADALLEIIEHYILHDEDARKHHSALFIEGMKDGYYRIKSKVLNMPTADVVEVVRCKDCVHYWKNGEDVAICLASPKDDAFCSEGERREDDKTRSGCLY